jgi:hypothetical protein
LERYEEAKREREGKPRGGSENEYANDNEKRDREPVSCRVEASTLTPRLGWGRQLHWIQPPLSAYKPDNFGWMERRSAQYSEMSFHFD